MLFCGTTFFCMQYSMDATSTNIHNITSITIQNGIYDTLYAGNINTEDGYNPSYPSPLPDQWNEHTVLYAKFNGSLSAGNIDIDLNTLDAWLIKRRRHGVNDQNWENIIKKSVESESFVITQLDELDKYARSGVKYDYVLVPLFKNGEQGVLTSIASITPDFEGIFIIEKDMLYHGLINVKMSTNKNRPVTVINTIDRLYPYVVTNGRNNYYTGSTSAVFMDTKEDDMYGWKFYDSREYRENFMEFLCNGNPKVLKHFDGRMFLISVVDNPAQDESVNNYYPITTFNWVEIGNAEDMIDLYNNNLTDYNGQIV